MRDAIIIDFTQLLVATQQRELRKRIQVQRQPVIHLPGPHYPSYCCQSCGHEYLTNTCQNCGRPHDDE